jgi:MoxR-like ATPase
VAERNGDYLLHYPEVADQIIGREGEIRAIMATLAAGKHIILEGPPGTTKSTILRAVTRTVGVPFYFVAGSGDLTPAKLIGHFNPARVMEDTYSPEHFNEGPLVQAMHGGFLYIEEFNRVPADTANVLITAVEEGEISIPRYGTVCAGPDFRVICSQNPMDDVGTVRISRALYDRFCCLRLNYQSLEEELEILSSTLGTDDETINLVAVHLVRATRNYKEIKQGASIRGALDMVTLFHELGKLQELSYIERMEEAMLMGLSSKIWLSDTCIRTSDEVLNDILDEVLLSLELEGLEKKFGFGSAFQVDDEGKGEEGVFRDDVEVDDQMPKSDPTGQRRQIEVTVDEEQLAEELKRRSKEDPEETSRFLNQNPEIAAKILTSPDVLEMYSYIKDKVSEDLRETAKRYASRLIIKIATKIANIGIKSGNLQPVADFLASDEIEIDHTLERIVERPTEKLEDNLVVLARKPERKGCVVVLDHSSSMQGIKVAIAALTAATIALHFKENYGVVAFSTRAAVLKGILQTVAPTQVAEQVLSLDARGYTNIREALQLSIAEVRAYDKKIGILLTDGDWTYGGDPLQIARLFDRLHVIGLEDPNTYSDFYGSDGRFYHPRYGSRIEVLAKEGRGTFAYVQSIDEVPLAITRCLTS